MERREKIVISVLFSFLVLIFLFFAFLKIREKILGEIKVYIFLTKQENNESIIVPVERKVKCYGNRIEDKIKASMRELLKGPTEEEKKDGLSTSLNEKTNLYNVEIEGDVVNLDFSKDVEEGGGTLLMETRIAQIVYTATQFPEIKKVRFLIEGKPINYFSGEGITIVEKPIGRDDLKEFEIKIIEEGKNEEGNSS